MQIPHRKTMLLKLHKEGLYWEDPNKPQSDIQRRRDLINSYLSPNGLEGTSSQPSRRDLVNSYLSQSGLDPLPYSQPSEVPSQAPPSAPQSSSSLDRRRQMIQSILNELEGPRLNQDFQQNPGPQPSIYTPEEERRLLEYKKLIDNWDSFKEFVDPQFEALGKAVMAKAKEVKSWVVGEDVSSLGIDKNNLDRNVGIEALKKSESHENFFLSKFSSSHNSFLKNSIYDEEIKQAIDASIEEFNKQFFDLYSNASKKGIAQLHELALAHHILLEEGFKKDAVIIDNFVKEFFPTSIQQSWMSTKGIVSNSTKYINKSALNVGEAASSIGRAAWGGLGYLGKLFPIVGLAFSIPFFIKNSIEALENGRRIFRELPLQRYGWDATRCLYDGAHVIDTFRSAFKANIKRPRELERILTILRTIGAFWIDALMAITNLVMSILDALTLITYIVTAFGGPVGWAAGAVALGGSFLFNAGIIGLELGSEYFKEKLWSSESEFAKKMVLAEIDKLTNKALAPARA